MSRQVKHPVKALLKIGYLCNYRCSFCHAETKKQIKDIAIKILYLKILLLKKKGVWVILLSWGESTLEKHFFQIVEYIRKQGLSYGIVTNGSTIASNEFLAKLHALWLEYIYLSLHGYQDVHNTIVWDPSSFEKVLSIVKNVTTNYQDIHLFLNYVVVANNVHSIEDTIIALRELHQKKISIKFSFLEPEWAWDNRELMVSPKVASKTIREVIQKYSNESLQIYWDGFPICHFRDMLDRRADLQTENILYITEIYEHTIYHTNYWKRYYTHTCDTKCSLRTHCYGIFEKYREYYPEDELIAI